MELAERSKTVERTALIKRAEDRLAKIKAVAADNGPTEQWKPLINIFGMTGIGKTTVLKQIHSCLSQRYQVVFLSFDRTFGQNADWQTALSTLAGLSELAELGAPVTVPPELHDLLTEVIAPVEPAPPERQGLLLIDGLDDKRLVKWIEHAVIEPLIRGPSTAVVVYTSQAKVTWDDWHLNNAVDSLELATFSRTEARELLELHALGDRQPLVDAVYEFSQGYPLAVLGIIEERQLEQYKRASDQRKQRVVIGEVADLLEVDELASDRRAIVTNYLTALRYLEVPVMQQLLSEVGGLSERRAQSMSCVRSLNKFIGQLRERELTKRYRADLPEQFIEPLRIAALTQGAAEHGHSAVTIANTLAQIYYTHAYKSPKSSSIYTLEYLLFAATAIAADLQRAQLPFTLELIKKLFRRTMAVLRNSPDAQTAQRYTLPLLFYRDDQLIELLRSIELSGESDANLFAFVDRRIGELLGQITGEPGASGLYRTALPEYERSLLKVLASLEDRVPLELAEDDLPANGHLTGRMIQRLVFRFSDQTMQEYRQSCREDALLTPRVVTTLLNTFAERGVIDRDEQRHYRPSRILSHMWETLAPRTLAEATSYDR